MTIQLRDILLGALLAAAVIVPGWAARAKPAAAGTAAIFAHSRTVVEPRFSDEIVGHGPDLVFIPGLASSRQTWKGVAGTLAAHYRLHLIQVAGFAGEPARANAHGPVVIPTAEAIHAYLKRNRLTPAVLIGHSLGGTMILYIAEHYPHDVKKALVVDARPSFGAFMTHGNSDPKTLAAIADAIRSGKSSMTDAQRAQMMQSMAKGKADLATIARWSRQSDPGTVRNATADDVALDLTPGLGRIAAPITLLYPDYVPLGAAPGQSDAVYRGLYAAAPTVTLVPVRDSLHFIMFDRPKVFAADLANFLGGRAGPDGSQKSRPTP